MSFASAMAQAEAHHKQLVAQDTWGHLAPKKDMTYGGVIVFAVGLFAGDGIITLKCELGNGKESLSSSPWFYEALYSLLGKWRTPPYDEPLPESWPEVEEGGVYEWRGTFRNYEFDGVLRRMELSRCPR